VRRPLRLPPLYPIVDLHDDSDAERRRVLALARQLAEAGVEWIQLRGKTLAAGALDELASSLVLLLRSYGAHLIVNDRADVALLSGAAGVHVGDEDIPVEAARSVLGSDAIVGYSTHSLEDVAAASTVDANYFGFGPVYESPTKKGVRAAHGVALLEQACHISNRPIVAIGGVTLSTAPLLWKAGAKSVAVISEIERAADPRALAQAYLRAAAN
jgi:thiamine-phosphate pyrophosphorylase